MPIFASVKGSKFCWPRLELSKLFHLGQYTVGRRILYNTGTRETQAVLGLEKGGTMVEVTAGLGGERAFTKSIKISQLIDENNMITPMVSADNTLSLQWARSLKGGNLVTTTFTPNDSVLILWKDGPWIANIAVSLNGLTPLGSNISVTRELNF